MSVPASQKPISVPTRKHKPNPKASSSVVGTGVPGPGRRKGIPNKLTVEVKEMVRQALEKAGGIDYLVSCAKTAPGPFLTLVNKMMPTAIEAEVKGSITYVIETGVPHDDD